MTEYFIHDGTKELGPFTLIQLSSQKIQPDTPVWHKGLAGWTRAQDLAELEPLLAQKLSPPPFRAANTSTGRQRTVLIFWAAGIFAIFFLIWYFSSRHSADRQAAVPVDSAQIHRSDSLIQRKQMEQQQLTRQAAARNLNYRNNWNRYIWTTHNRFKQSLLGGISGLEVGIVNETDHVLDEVIVSVRYIKSNGGTYKTEPVEIYAVPAHGRISVPAPSSERGRSVVLEISAISSKKIDFCYSSDIDIRGSKDPYRCKTK